MDIHEMIDQNYNYHSFWAPLVIVRLSVTPTVNDFIFFIFIMPYPSNSFKGYRYITGFIFRIVMFASPNVASQTMRVKFIDLWTFDFNH